MKTMIVYSSKTGFTKRYAQWLAEALGAEMIPFEEARKKDDSFFADADAILYGGWSMAGKITNVEWFKGKIPGWKGKKLALFCVGASPAEIKEVEQLLQNILTEEEKKVAKAFYCQGGLAYEKMSLPCKIMMKVYAGMMKKKKDATQMEKDMAEMICHSYDISDRKFIEPIVEYIQGSKE